MIETSDGWIDYVEAFDQRLVELPDRTVVEERAATLVLPRAGDAWNAQCGVHLRSAVAAAREAIAEPEIASRRLANEFRERHDFCNRNATNVGCPLRRAALQMRFELVRAIRIGRHVITVRVAVAKQHMHHAASKRAVSTRPQDNLDVGLLHRIIVIDIDHGDLCAAFFSGARRMRHHIDLRVDGVGAPDHHQIRLRHFARIDARDLARAGRKSRPGDRRTDR